MRLHVLPVLRRFFTAATLLVVALRAGAQITGGNAFMKGDYVELGIAPNGAFGSTINKPAGYHARPTPVSFSMYDPGTGAYNLLDSALGFLADPAKDGWTVGANVFIGDYFMPGTPQEGWAIGIGSNESQAWLSNYSTMGATGYTGTGGLSGSNVSYTNNGTESNATWEGTMGNLMVRQRVRLRKDKLYFTVYVTVKNNSAAAINDIYYMRSVDADNEVSISGDFTTDNTIDFQLPNAQLKTLVSMQGLSVPEAYLGLGTKDCRAKAFIIDDFATNPLTPQETGQQIYNGTAPAGAYYYTQGMMQEGDVGTGLAFKVGTLAAGDSTTFAYAYILNEADLDEALDATLPQFFVNSTAFITGDSITYLGCGGQDTLTLQIVNGDDYDWTWYPSLGLSDTVGDSVVVTLPGNTVTYFAVATAPCGTDTVKITLVPVNGTPPPTVSSPVQYCVGDMPSPLTATGAYPLQWWSVSIGGAPLPGAPTPATTSAYTTTWYVSQVNAGCSSGRVPITVIVNDFPGAPQVVNPTYFCQNSAPGPLTAVGTNLLWYADSTGGAGLSTAPTPVTTGLDTVVYYVSQSNGICEGPRTPLTVIISPIPAAPAVASVPDICQYSPAQPLSATGSNLLWYTSPTGTGSSTPIVPNTATPGTVSYYVTQTVAGCEGPQAAISVTVLPGLPAPTVVTPVHYCQHTLPVPLIQASGMNLKWYTTASGGSGSAITPAVDTANTGTTHWYVSQSHPNGCESPRAEIVVNVYPEPAPPQVSTPVVYCQFDTAQFLEAEGQSLLWYNAATGGVGNPNTQFPNTLTAGNTTYYVTQTVNGCESDRAPLTVAIHFKPTADLVAGILTACNGDTLRYSYEGNATPAELYTWAVTPAGNTAILGQGQEIYVVYPDAGEFMVSLQVDNLGCKSAVVTAPATIHPVPSLDYHLPPDLCVGQPVEVALSYASDPIATYQWDFGGASLDYSASTYGIHWDQPGTYVLSVTALARNCRSRPFLDTVTVHPAPSAALRILNPAERFCTGDTVYLAAQSTGGYTYQWSPANAILGAGNLGEAMAAMRLAGFVTLTVQDVYGCEGRDSLYINAEPCCTATMPTAFTPNGDGRNDEFRPVTPGHHNIITFRVMNRWGKMIFESKDQRRGWDGTSNGVPQDVGTYFYYIRYRCSNGQENEMEGDVTLIR